jgi:alkylation response protein AidB-like acyl-CoA dehydrogenase
VNFVIDEDASDLLIAVEDFVEHHGVVRAVSEAALTGPAADRERWAALCELGLPALALPEPDGLGADLLEIAAVAERLGAVLLPEPAAGAIMLVELCGAHRQVAGLADEICEGRCVGALFGFETVELAASGAVNGRAWVPDDGLTELVALLAADSYTSGPAVVIVDADSLEPTGAKLTTDPTRPWAEVEFRDSEPAETFRIGLETARRVRREIAVLTAAELVGGMQKVLDETIVYVGDRHQFGRPIGSYQAVKHQLADMYVATEQARALVQFAAIASEQDNPEAGASASSAARWVPRAAAEVCDRAIHLHGAMGYSWELDIHLYLRRALAMRELLSHSEIVRPARTGMRKAV